MTITPTTSRSPQWVPHAHAVQFYEKEEFLYQVVGDYIADGLVAFEPAVVIATPEHCEGMSVSLRERGFDVAQLRSGGQLTFLDAREALATFMSGHLPDADRFRQNIGSVVARTARAHRGANVRAYGEMVD